MSDKFTCKVCGKEGLRKEHIFKEMLLGTGEVFQYLECAACGSLQIKEIPTDIGRYYPARYFSLISPPAPDIAGDDNAVARWARRARSSYLLKGRSAVGLLMNALRPVAGQSADMIARLKRCRAATGSRVLDVGCGKGALLSQLDRLGFEDLTGIDPYAERDAAVAGRAKILKKALKDIDGKFDVIILNHSLEHMADPRAAFGNIARLLPSGGFAMVRTPIVPSYAWERYGSSWAQLDAPRHLFVMSLAGMRALAENAGLKIQDTAYDSTEFQFIASEQYLKGIPLSGARSYYVDPSKSIFSKEDVERFAVRAAELNRQGAGDQAAVYLTKA